VRHSAPLKAEREWLFVAAIAPLLMFPTVVPFLTVTALVLLLVVWAALHAGGRRPMSTAFDGPMAVLVAMAVVSFWISPSRDLALPKLAGVVLGVLAFRSVTFAAGSSAGLRWAVALYILAGGGVVAGGLLAGPSWQRKSNALFAIASRIPTIFPSLPGIDHGVNPNALGGTVLFFIPLLTALAAPLARVRIVRPADGSLASEVSRGVYGCGIRGAAGLLAAACAIVLILTESRTCWLSAIVALTAMAVVRGKRHFVLTALAVLSIAIAMQAGLSPQNTWGRTREAVLKSARLDLRDRPEIWRRAIVTIWRNPVTGIGFGGFRYIVRVPSAASGAASTLLIPHAHNIFLQVTLDVGVPGLAAYLGLLLIATVRALRVHRVEAGRRAVLALGLWANLVAIHVFGLVDAISLGAKVGLFFWWDLGLIAALANHTGGRLHSPAAAPTGRVGEELQVSGDQHRRFDYSAVTEAAGQLMSQVQLRRMRERYAWANAFAVGRDVLEVGCGGGQGLSVLLAPGRRIWAGDIDFARVTDVRGEYGSEVRCLQFDAQALPFAAKSLDTVIFFEGLYYLTDVSRFLAECRRVLRPGGVVLLATANRDVPDFAPSAYSTFYPNCEDLRDLVAAHGFESQFFGGSPRASLGRWYRLLSPLKRIAAKHHLFPATLSGRTWLKRVVFGRLVAAPRRLYPECDGVSRPAAIPPLVDGKYQVLYCAARSPNADVYGRLA